MNPDVRIPDRVLFGGNSYQVLTSCLIVKSCDRTFNTIPFDEIVSLPNRDPGSESYYVITFGDVA